MHARAVSPSSTVPAPTTTASPWRSTTFSITFTADGTVIVSSTTSMPPARMASPAAVAIGDGGPVVHGRGPGDAECRLNHRQVRILASHRVEHGLICAGIELAVAPVGTLDRKPEGRREVLLVAQQHIDATHQPAVDR